MVDAERTQGPPPEQQARAAETASSSSSGVRTLRDRLEALINEHKEIRSLKEEYIEKGYISDEEQQKKAILLKTGLSKLISDIQVDRAAAREFPPLVFSILTDKNIIKTITPQNSPVIYELIRITQPGALDINTPEGVNSVLEGMLSMYGLEPFTTRKIIEKILDDAKARNFAESDQIKRAKKKLPHYSEDPLEKDRQKKQIRARHEEREGELLEGLSPIQGVTLTQAAQDRIRRTTEAEYRALGGEGVTSSFVEDVIQERIKAELSATQQNIAAALSAAVGAYASHDQRKALGEYKSVLTRLRVADTISPEDYQMLLQLYEDPVFTEPIIKAQKKMEGQDLVERAKQIFVPTKEQERVLMGLSSAQSLENLLKTATSKIDKDGKEIGREFRYLKFEGVGLATHPNGEINFEETDFKNAKINWTAFMEDVKGVFGELLSIADRNPNQQFEQAFNSMYEGHLYQQLLQRISHLGAQIDSSEIEFFNGKKIEIKGQITDRKPGTPDNPGLYLMFEKTQEISLSEAIGGYLANEMNDFKLIRSHLHNINFICSVAQHGKGWEQLKHFAENLDMYKIDKLYRQEEYLGLASNLYATALQQEMAENGKVVRGDFGLGDDRYQLNSAERRAFFQMKAVLQAKHPELTESALNQQAIQKIRMAAAIAYGVTGEFWNVMLTVRMPIGSKDAVNYATGEKGSEVNMLYSGTHHAGYETMIADLDLDLLLQRFGLPKFYNDLRYVTRHKDMRHPPNPYSPEGYWHHGLNSEARIEIENAMVNGRSKRLTEMDERYSYFMDYMRTTCVGFYRRGGWRFGNADAYIIYKDAARRNVDLVRTYAEVRLMGSFITRKFLDDNLTKINAAEAATLRPGAQMSAEDRKILDSTDTSHNIKKQKTEVLYKYFLFPQIANVTPTKYLQMEARRWTPRGEKLLRDDMCSYLKERHGATYPTEILNQHIYSMYVAALTLAEKSAWMTFKNQVVAAKEAQKTDPTIVIPDINTYMFDDSKFQGCTEELRSFYEQYKTEMGVHTTAGGTISVKIEEEFGEFMNILKGFQGRLRSSINAPRFHNEYNTGTRETLEQRFAYSLAAGGNDSNGNIANLIAGDDFDMEHFYFGAVGGRTAGRFLGETNEVTSKANPALKAIINEVLPDIIRGNYKDIHEFEKVIREKLAPKFKEIHTAISIMDKNQADEYCISLALFIANMIGKDRIMRIKGVGGLIDWSRRAHSGSQSSTYTDFFVNILKRPTHALDSDEIYAMGHLIFDAIQVPFTERIQDHTEVTKNLFGIPIGTKTIFKDEINPEYEIKKLWGLIPYRHKKHRESDYYEWHEHIFAKASGLTGVSKWIENYIPMGAAAILFVLIAMAYLADKKNKKK